LLTGQPRSATVVAQERVEALVIDKNTLMVGLYKWSSVDSENESAWFPTLL
jgi:hypothetical protein